MPAPAQSRLERLLSNVAPVKAGEGTVVVLLFLNIFTLLFAYYLIKPVREALILTQTNAEVRSYALAAQALVLMVIVPFYTSAFRRVLPHYQLVPWITGLLAANLLVFVVLGKAGYEIGVAYFIWIGIFNVLIVAQFWAYAADLFNVEAGERLFVLIMAGASIGSWAGSVVSEQVFKLLDSYEIMLAAMILMFTTIPMSFMARARVPRLSRAPHRNEHPDAVKGTLAGFRLVLADPYMRLIAIFMILLNCVNSTGEYLQAGIVREHATAAVAAAGGGDAATLIGEFYGQYYAWTNILSLAIQLFLVARIFRSVGVDGAMLVLPVIAMLGYAAIAIVPAFTLVRIVKLAENSVNYSLQNTARHALFLPCPNEDKYAGKTAIDTFFWRVGDLLQAGMVWAGHEWLGATPAQFAALNFVMATVWVGVALRLGGFHRRALASSPAAAH
jgi:AAA family ATP:ADP antiporter